MHLASAHLTRAMSHDTPIVFVVDDDPLIRNGVRSLIGSVGLQVLTFGSAREFLLSARPDAPACMVLDVRLPDLSGLDLQRELRELDIHIPIIFITGHGDIPMTVEAMKAGAAEFLTKPFRGQDLLDAVQRAIARDRDARQERAEIAELRKYFDTLSPKEREVLRMVVSGLLNKQIAAELGISELTVKTHRAHIMEKMRADSLASLVRITERLRSVAPRE
jgi:RNA polymerase sigma factor (sigma-70 family)